MRILLSLIIVSAFIPLPVQAYLTPEEVIESGDFVDPPPNARGAKAARAAQEAEYDARMVDEALENAMADEEAPPAENTINGLRGAASNDEEVVDWEPEESDVDPEQRRDERVLERVERNRLDDMAINGVVLRGSAPDEPLHGGAPLAPTGMGTIVGILAITVATGLTLRAALRA